MGYCSYCNYLAASCGINGNGSEMFYDIWEPVPIYPGYEIFYNTGPTHKHSLPENVLGILSYDKQSLYMYDNREYCINTSARISWRMYDQRHSSINSRHSAIFMHKLASNADGI